MSTDKSPAQQALLSTEQMGLIQGAISDLQPQQLVWLSGYFAGLSGQNMMAGAVAAPIVGDEAASGAVITILYGSQTGNAHGVAKRMHEQLTSKGAAAKLVDMEDYNPRHLKNETHMALVVSTQGEGDPPDSARAFLEFVEGKKAPKLEGLTYSVMGLGDSSYEFYCKTGKDFDERLAALGASRVAERIDADIDYQAETEQWLEQWQSYWDDNLAGEGSAVTAAPAITDLAESAFDKFSPFTAEVIDNFPITGEGTGKNIIHVEVSLENSGLRYQPGDALGIWHINDEVLVDEILTQCKLDGAAEIIANKSAKTLREALIHDREITLMHPKLVEYLVENSGENDNRLVWKGLAEGERADFLAAIYKRQVVEVLTEMPHAWQPQEFFDQLRPLTPRLYSIASSQSAVDEEVHITVREVVENRQGKKRFGGASHFLAGLPEDNTLKVFIEHNKHFHIPANDSTPMIMVGAGTGVAPYRRFMQEREERGADGENWLFFGNSNARYEFLYQTEWQNWYKSGLLTKIDLAFSRDQAERIYVQDRIRQQGEELLAWLERGAYFYVCGDKNAMAKAVEQALIDIIAGHNDQGVEFAKAYLDDLQRAGRYLKDVY